MDAALLRDECFVSALNIGTIPYGELTLNRELVDKKSVVW